eukprot:gene5149-biopygen5524
MLEALEKTELNFARQSRASECGGDRLGVVSKAEIVNNGEDDENSLPTVDVNDIGDDITGEAISTNGLS